MELDVLRQKGGVADERDVETDAHDDSYVQRIRQKAPTGTRHVYHTVTARDRVKFKYTSSLNSWQAASRRR